MMNDHKKKGVAIMPGSYDPITVGHLDVIRRTAMAFDKVFVALMINPEKNYMFDKNIRVELAKASLSDLDNVEVIYDEGMLSDLAVKLGCDAIVKGIRNEKDLAYESEMARYNKEKCGIETIFIDSDKEYSYVSSTLVRDYIEKGDLSALDAVLPKGALDIIKKEELNDTYQNEGGKRRTSRHKNR